MTIRLRKLPVPVIVFLAVFIVFLWVAFMVGPIYNLATSRIATGRVVLASGDQTMVLVDNQAYPVHNDCIVEHLLMSCTLTEGQVKTVLIRSRSDTGYLLSQQLQFIGLGILGTILFTSLGLEARFRKQQPALAHHHYHPHE